MAGEQKYTVDIGVTGLSSLSKLQSSIDTVHQRMTGLKNVLATGLFLGLGAGALRMADDLQDLANATGIATARLLELKKALGENGGQVDQLAQGVTTFTRSIDEAAQGSLKAQNTFDELKISLQDLRTLSEQELMVKALKGIGGIENASRRAAILMDLFGKSFRTVDAAGLGAQLERTAGSADKYAAALKRGAELNDALATAGGNVKLAFLEAFSPIIQSLNEFNAKTAEGEARMTTLVTAIKIAGAALVASFSVGILLGVVTAIGQIGRGLAVIAGLGGTAGAGIAAGMTSAFAASGQFLKALRAIAVLFSAGLGIYTATQLFDDFGSTAVNALARITELVGGLIGMLAGGALGAAFGSAFGPIGTVIGGLAGAFGGDKLADALGMKSLIEKAKEARESAEKLAQEQKRVATETKKASAATEEQAKAIARAVDTSAFDNAVRGIRKVGEEFKENGRRISENIQLETIAIGQSKQANDLEAARTALANRAYDAVKQLREAQASMSKDQKDAGLGKVYDEEIAKVQALARAEGERLPQLIGNLAKAKKLEEERLFAIKENIQAEDDLLKIQKEMNQIGLGDTLKAQMDLASAADQRALAEIRAREAVRNEKLTEEERNKVFAESKAQLAAVTDATNKLAEAKEKFAQKESVRLFDLKTEYELQDKLLGIQREVADIGLLDIEKKYRDVARAADDSAKAAIRAEEERRSVLAGTRQYLDPSEVEEYYKRARAGTESLVRSQKKLYDSSRTFSSGWNSAFKQYVENASNAAKTAERLFEKFTSGIEDLIVDFAKTGKFEWKSFVDSMLEELLRSQIKQTMASIMQVSNPFGSGSIGDMFGGLFGGLGGGGATKGQSANNPMYVLDVAGGGAGGLGGIMGPPAPGGSGGGFIDTIGNIFGGVKDAVGSVFGGIGDAVSGVASSIGGLISGGGIGGGGGGGFLDSIASGIGDLFGGFFANGGNIGAGQFGMVGENGPELVGGPASVTPMGGSTNVTYNIQATDAASFQALVARDPGFIFAVTEQGRRGASGTRR